MAARSRSKTRAVPSNTSRSKPAVFTTAPSGARVPRRMAIPPLWCSGLSSVRITSPSTGMMFMSARFSASVLPVTVRASPCSRPASSRAFITTGTPPTRSTSFITYLPNGLRSAMCGTLSLMRLKSSSESSTLASCAMASRWSTALVEPPKAMSTAMAFSNAFFVRMSRAVMPSRIRLTTASPERWAK